MAYYSALVANTQNGSSVLISSWLTNPSGAGVNPGPIGGGQSSYTRIAPIIAPHFTVEDPGGFIAADFIVPGYVAGNVVAHLRFGAWCWLYDGRTPIFYGKMDTQPRPDTNGDVVVSLTGFWGLLYTTRFREAWDDPDMSKWVPSPPNFGGGNIELRADDKMRVVIPKGVAPDSGDQLTIDYLLFNEEPAGFTRDDKRIAAYDMHCEDDQALGNANFTLRVVGRQTVVGGVNDILFSDTGASGSSSSKEGALANTWADSRGYRLLRIGLYVTANTAALAADRYLVFDRLRVGTRETLLTTFGSPPDSSDLAADLMENYDQRVVGSGVVGLDYFDLPNEFFQSNSSSITGAAGLTLPQYGSDPVTRGVAASGVGVDSMTFSDWVSPAEALSAFSAIDGFQCGFYFPANPQTGWWSTTKLPWSQQMPQMTYEAWADLATPDYQVMIRRGAEPEMDDSPQPLINVLYVNYEKAAGRQFSIVVQDNTRANYLMANGMNRGEDYTIDTPVSGTVAQNLATQVFTLRRQPLAVGRVTVWANRPGSITDGGGALISRLSQLRPGVVQIGDLPRTAYKTGRCTRIEWWGETLDEAEHAELTLEHPGTVSLPRRLGAVGVLAQRTIRVRGGQRKRR